LNHAAPETNSKSGTQRGSKFDRWRAVAVDLWITVVILQFFVLRVLESNTARRIFQSMAAR
jgi:hypothetical protein